MKRINISEWKEFKLEEIFDIHPTKSYKYINKDLLNIEGNNRVIGNSAYNNGIIGYSILDNTEEGNIITFSDTTSSEAIFYQKESFIGYSPVKTSSNAGCGTELPLPQTSIPSQKSQ